MLLHILFFIQIFFFTYVYAYSLVLFYIKLHCPLSGPDLHFTADYILYNRVYDE